MSVLLEAKKVSKSFGTLMVVNSVSLTVNEGEIVGLVGPNGAGKSTFFSLISGYYRPDSGQTYFEGKEITNSKNHEVAALGMSRTFQIVKPFGNMTVLENVMVGAFKLTSHLSEARKKASAVVERLGLGKKRDFLASHLTLPDRKRLEVARALATEPKLLLLDEVMAGMNQGEITNFLPVIKEIRNQGTSIIIVEHVMYVVMNLADRIVVLNEGQKIAEGTPAEISVNKNVIDAYLGEEYSLAQG